jgi:hypothetical protein
MAGEEPAICLAMADRARAQGLSDAAWWDTTATILADAGAFPQALAAAVEAARRRPDDPWLLLHRDLLERRAQRTSP